MSLRWVDLLVADRPLKACLDSGAEITVLRLETVPAACLEQSKGTIKLKGAFGQVVTADSAYVPLSLVVEGESAGQQVLTLCAITDELSDSLGALLTPEVYEELLQVRSVLEREAVEIQVMENEMDQDFRRTPKDTLEDKVFECETTENEDATDVDAVEVDLDQPEIGPRDECFAREQWDDPTLSDAWEQARDGTHGMLVEDGLLFHRDEFEGKSCKLPSTRRRSVLELAHDTPCGGHFSQRKTKQRIRSAFFWPTMAADVKRHCQTCHTCQTFSRKQVTDRVPITPLTRPEQPFQVVYMDCIGPLEPPSARGYRYALSVVDLCTRWAE
ncbi:polyprotein of retroviral origin, putative [Ixodes scapularis]|uniref:RNA-directed DNA polymerase n=1 Tax=Ixodes scapularis TaxID=6945 RepID=B7QC72_IXOSC|nr:polyprotein of retroviral origin, putative [Ixodes scapularis]|eukprot:XP_002413136.1 polyprotein of retroviral origin, putative [Ixodes scapularis]